jgi:DNA-binding MarR family transcriptional regulator
MRDVQRVDLLFQSVLAKFFSIPARRPASGTTTFAQMRALWNLERQPSASLSGLARSLGISNPAATEMVDRLVERGYVRRIHSPKDRRQVILSLRPKGNRLLADFAKRRQERFEKLLRVVDRSEVGRLAEALQIVSDVLERWHTEGQ